MRITLLCSDHSHPIIPWLDEWIKVQSIVHSVDLVQEKEELKGGDLLLLISCHQLIQKSYRNLFRETLVIHSSNLPFGRGWSPHVWQVIAGKTEIVVTLFEAEDAVDAGDIWKQQVVFIPRHCLWNEINNALFQSWIELMNYAVSEFDTVSPQKQPAGGGEYFSKRTPADSQVDINKSIAQQFDLLRVCDPLRYPAFFEIHGHKYKVTLEKSEKL